MFAFTTAPGVPFSVFDVSAALREEGWLVPAYTFPKNREDIAALRIVVRNGLSHDLAHLLLDDLRRVLPRLQRQAGPGRGPEAACFAHGAGRPPATTAASSRDGGVRRTPGPVDVGGTAHRPEGWSGTPFHPYDSQAART